MVHGGQRSGVLLFRFWCTAWKLTWTSIPKEPSLRHLTGTGTQLWNGSGGIWFSNNWVGTPPATMEQLLGGRNLVVHCDQGFARL